MNIHEITRLETKRECVPIRFMINDKNILCNKWSHTCQIACPCIKAQWFSCDLSFSCNVFKSHHPQSPYDRGLFGKDLNSQTIGILWCKSSSSFYSRLVNPLLHRYGFQCINNRQVLKTVWEKKKLLVTSNFFFSHNVFHSIIKLCPHLSKFLTSYLYLLLNCKSPKLACEVKG